MKREEKVDNDDGLGRSLECSISFRTALAGLPWAITKIPYIIT